MSYTPVEQQPPDDGGQPATPQTTPYLPIVQVRDERPRLRSFFSLEDAVSAARVSSKHLFDIRGLPVALVEDEYGTASLEVSGAGDPEGVKGRVVDLLRQDVEAGLRGGRDSGVEAVLRWFEAAPTFECLAYAAARAQDVFSPIPTVVETFRCTPGCTAHQRAVGVNPPCCPGW